MSNAPTDTGWLMVTAGNGFACGRKSDGVPVCWGLDDLGQTSVVNRPVLMVDAGLTHACGLQADGYANCWGDHSQGATVAPADRFKKLSAGVGLTCGITTKHATRCWGRTDLDSDTGMASNDPRAVPSGDFSAVEAGDNMACAIATKGGGITCWGDTSAWSDAMFSGTGFTQVSLNQGEACTLNDAGLAHCGGLDAAGGSLSGTFTQVSAGVTNGCALASTHVLSCWALDDASLAAATGP